MNIALTLWILIDALNSGISLIVLALRILFECPFSLNIYRLLASYR